MRFPPGAKGAYTHALEVSHVAMTRRSFAQLVGFALPAAVALSKEALAQPAGTEPTTVAPALAPQLEGLKAPAKPIREMVDVLRTAEKAHNARCWVRRLELYEFWVHDQEEGERWFEVGCEKCGFNWAFSLRREMRVHTFKA